MGHDLTCPSCGEGDWDAEAWTGPTWSRGRVTVVGWGDPTVYAATSTPDQTFSATCRTCGHEPASRSALCEALASAFLDE